MTKIGRNNSFYSVYMVYKPLPDLNFARYMHATLWQLHAIFSFGVYKPLGCSQPYPIAVVLVTGGAVPRQAAVAG